MKASSKPYDVNHSSNIVKRRLALAYSSPTLTNSVVTFEVRSDCVRLVHGGFGAGS
jgi:hypothetical protein